MYEQAEPRDVIVRRVMWLALWFIVIVAVLWALIWLVFLRGNKTDVAKKNDTLKSHSQDSGTNKSNESKSQTHGAGSSATTGSGAAGGTATQQQSGQNTPATGTGAAGNASQSSQLANTGAGNVVLPVMVATVAGTVLYHVHLRRKYQLD